MPGALEIGSNKGFQSLGNISSGEIRLKVWRDMDEADTRNTGDGSKGYDVVFRYTNASNYCALQIRGDGFYRILRVSNGVPKALVGDNKGGFLPIPRWDRDSLYDDVVVTFSDETVSASFNGHKLLSSNKAGTGSGKIGVSTNNGLKIAVEKMSVDEVKAE